VAALIPGVGRPYPAPVPAGPVAIVLFALGPVPLVAVPFGPFALDTFPFGPFILLAFVKLSFVTFALGPLAFGSFAVVPVTFVAFALITGPVVAVVAIAAAFPARPAAFVLLAFVQFSFVPLPFETVPLARVSVPGGPLVTLVLAARLRFRVITLAVVPPIARTTTSVAPLRLVSGVTPLAVVALPLAHLALVLFALALLALPLSPVAGVPRVGFRVTGGSVVGVAVVPLVRATLAPGRSGPGVPVPFLGRYPRPGHSGDDRPAGLFRPLVVAVVAHRPPHLVALRSPVRSYPPSGTTRPPLAAPPTRDKRPTHCSRESGLSRSSSRPGVVETRTTSQSRVRRRRRRCHQKPAVDEGHPRPRTRASKFRSVRGGDRA
jgi:hypothetical protein